MSNERLLETFLDLVRIDSPTGKEAACANYCAEKLRRLGFDVRFDDSAAATGSDIGNLIAVLPGTKAGTLALSAHFDCVDPCIGVEPTIVDGIVYSGGETVLGGDDKVGLAASLEAFERLVESGEERPTLKAVFSVQEEIGLVGAKHLHPEDVTCDLCLVLDAAGAPGGIVVGAPTHYTFKAEFFGRAAHAGVQPERGVSAVAMAAESITKMRLGRLDERTTANVGVISGGTATNVVAARVELKGECRSLDRSTVEALRSEMEARMREAADAAGGSVSIEWTREYAGFLVPLDSEPVRIVSAACEACGLTPVTYTSGGGSDANILAEMGVPVLALGSGMEAVHSTNEQLAIKDLEDAAALCVAVARQMAEGT